MDIQQIPGSPEVFGGFGQIMAKWWSQGKCPLGLLGGSLLPGQMSFHLDSRFAPESNALGCPTKDVQIPSGNLS